MYDAAVGDHAVLRLVYNLVSMLGFLLGCSLGMFQKLDLAAYCLLVAVYLKLVASELK